MWKIWGHNQEFLLFGPECMEWFFFLPYLLLSICAVQVLSLLLLLLFLSLYVLQEVEYVVGDETVSSGRGLH